MGKYFAERRVLAFGHDHLGHGHTSGERVQGLSSFHDDYVEPMAAHCVTRKKLEGEGLPMFILGSSMGGLMAVMTAQFSPPGLNTPKKYIF